jgi:hypothetical protein
MKVVDFKAQKESGKKPGAVGRALTNLSSSSQAKGDAKARETITNALNRVLNHRFYMLYNTQLEGLDVPIPQILVGPTGLWLILATSIKGIFRATDDVWEQMDQGTHQFKPGKPGLLEQILWMSRAVENHLAYRELAFTKVEPVLFFSDPGVHIDASHPAARIVLADGLERFTASLIQATVVLDKEGVQKTVDALAESVPGWGQEQPPEPQDGFTFKEEPSQKKKPARPSPLAPLANVGRGEPEIIKQVSKKAAFTRRQWLLLGLLVIGNIIILVAVVLAILKLS